jgi:hypothetical protein
MNTSIVSDPKVIGKARQLVASGNVRPTIDPYRWAVQSQSDFDTIYIVDLRRSVASCTCPAKKPCKHILAVKLFQALQRDIERFINAREDFDLGKLLDELARRNPVESEREKNECFIAVANVLRKHEAQQPPTPPQSPSPMQQAATVFFLRYWWPGMNPEAALDPLTLEHDKARDVQVRWSSSSNFRNATQPLDQILAYIEEQGLKPGTPKTEHQRRGSGSAREWLFTVPVYKEKAQ